MLKGTYVAFSLLPALITNSAQCAPTKFSVLRQFDINHQLVREFFAVVEADGSKILVKPVITNFAIIDLGASSFKFKFLSQKYDCSFDNSKKPTEEWACGPSIFVLSSSPNSTPAIPIIDKVTAPVSSSLGRPLKILKKNLKAEFGVRRTSYNRFHLHSGIDIGLSFDEPIYPIGPGLVVFVSHIQNDGTVVIQHSLNGMPVYSKYVHIVKPTVNAGQVLTSKTPIGFAMNRAEFKHSKLPYNHVHLEIRKNFLDFGLKSSMATSLKELKENHYDPIEFFKKHS